MTARRHRVVCVLSDGMSSIGVAIANDLFGAPWEPELGVRWYSYRICSADPSPVRIGVLRAEVTHGASALSEADTVIIPGRGRRPPAPELLAALGRAYRRGARMVSFCTGAFILAEAGLLDGRPAATLWAHADQFRAQFPAVKLNPSVLYVDDGQVLTSAGNSAAADLALHILRADYGAAIANRVARQMVAPPHRAGGRLSTSRHRSALAPRPANGWPPPWNGRCSGWTSHCRSPHSRPAARSARATSPDSSATLPAPPRTSGCSRSGSRSRSSYWRPPTCPSTR